MIEGGERFPGGRDNHIRRKLGDLEHFRQLRTAVGVDLHGHEILANRLADVRGFEGPLFEPFAPGAIVGVEVQQQQLTLTLGLSVSRSQVLLPGDIGVGVAGSEGKPRKMTLLERDGDPDAWVWWTVGAVAGVTFVAGIIATSIALSSGGDSVPPNAADVTVILR